MKKITVILMAALTALSLAGCSEESSGSGTAGGTASSKAASPESSNEKEWAGKTETCGVFDSDVGETVDVPTPDGLAEFVKEDLISEDSKSKAVMKTYFLSKDPAEATVLWLKYVAIIKDKCSKFPIRETNVAALSENIEVPMNITITSAQYGDNTYALIGLVKDDALGGYSIGFGTIKITL